MDRGATDRRRCRRARLSVLLPARGGPAPHTGGTCGLGAHLAGLLCFAAHQANRRQLVGILASQHVQLGPREVQFVCDLGQLGEFLGADVVVGRGHGEAGLDYRLALLIGRDLPGRAIFRMIFFMPYVFSEVIVAIMWLGLFNPDPERGLINALLVLIPGAEAQPWLANTQTVLLCIFIVLTWKYFGFYLLLFMTGLQNIPADIEEAALIDGANTRQMTFQITIPLLGPTIRTAVYLSVLGSLQQFILVWIMSHGGPVNASEVMSTYMYRYGFVRFYLGYGSAVAIVMFLICLSFSLLYQRFTPQQDYLGGV